MRGAAAIVVMAVAAACDGGSKPEAQPDPKQVGAARPAHAFPGNAPPARTCQVDVDCTVVVDAPVGSDPCCNVTVTALPISVRYLQFMDQWQKQHCAGVSCPPMALPGAQTAPCGRRGRCDNGTCNNSCGLSPDGGIGSPTPP